MPQSGKQAIVILADGARADVFARMLAAGELPEIERHVVARGAHRTATSTFTSTTIPAHLPFLTGRFAGSANVPGYRWFDRAKQPRLLPLGPWSFRSYNGPEATRVDTDIAADAPTIFDLAPGSLNIFGAITRGLGRRGNIAAGRKNRLWMKAHFREDYVTADDAARKLLVDSLDAHAPFRFVVMPGIDWNSHYDDPFGEGAWEAYRRVDRTVGELARKLERTGAYDSTLIAVVSDHGHEPVKAHFDIGPELARRHEMKVAYHSLRAYRWRPEAVVAVSGNAMAHLYIDRPIKNLPDRLVIQPAIDIVAERRESGSILVVSQRGRARITETAAGITYEPLLGDPFDYPELPREMTSEQALELTAGTRHPDAPMQLAQIFRSPRTGDYVVSAAPGYDLRDKYERPEHRSSHGALHASHMNVPLAISTPVTDGPIRTADVFSTVLEYLGIPEPAGVDGRSRIARETQPERTDLRVKSNTP